MKYGQIICYYKNMKGTEKEKIYNLLKTISTYIHGYTPSSFSNNITFSDDIENTNKTLINYPNSENNTVLTTVQKTKDTDNSKQNDSNNTVSIDSLSEKIKNCLRCSLSNNRTNPVLGVGVKNPLVLVIGEQPNDEEDFQGISFAGQIGQLLDKMLSAISLSKNQNCYLTNIVKCKTQMSKDPLNEQISACYSFIEAQINILKPKMILVLGKNASQTMFRTYLDLNSLHGKIQDYKGIPIMATYNPSELIQNQALKVYAWQDLKLFREKLKEIAPQYELNFNKE